MAQIEKRFEKNQIVEVVITDIGESGEGIGRCDGYTLFVKDAIVGDLVRAIITKPKKNYAFAKLVEVLKSSADRIEPPCRNAAPCGGCQIQALSYEAQLRFKEKKVYDNLVRIGGFDEKLIQDIMEPIVGAGSIDEAYRYRNKAQYPIGKDKEGNIIAGFYAGRTHSIISCDDCLIGIKENKAILEIILSHMTKYNIEPYDEKSLSGLIRHVLIRKGFESGQIMVCIVMTKFTKLPAQAELIDRLIAVKGMTSICVSINPLNTNVIMGEEIHVIWGRGYIEDTMVIRSANRDFEPIENAKVTFEISPLSFYQVNPKQVEKLYSLALEYADLHGGEEVWDLCCGIGTISLCAAKYMEYINHGAKGKVYGIEVVLPAIEDAKRNAKKNNITNVEFMCAPVEEYLPSHMENINADVVIMDPPRKGVDEQALRVVADLQVDKIVYVSCDPATLARDLKFLCANGYELKRVRPVDMFMHSVHVETVCLLSRKA